MKDLFAVLGEERRPWIDPERIKETFHRLSREQHPDQQQQQRSSGLAGGGAKEGGADFTVLNLAQQTLSDPKSRLRHLLSLTHPEVSVSGPSAVPPTLADLMFPLQALLGQANAFLLRKNAAASELSRALLAGEGYELQEKIEESLTDLEKRLEDLDASLRRFDAEQWNAAQPAETTAGPLLGFYHAYAYLSRWNGQFREQLFQLAT